jgi:hypothetical protein
MTYADEVPTRTREHRESAIQRGSGGSMRQSLSGVADPARIAELESENNRLQLLVAELLIKNQQLRKAD